MQGSKLRELHKLWLLVTGALGLGCNLPPLENSFRDI